MTGSNRIHFIGALISEMQWGALPRWAEARKVKALEMNQPRVKLLTTDMYGVSCREMLQF
jgi:hypothetical protein